MKYKEAGVDIDAGNELVNRIKPFAKATTRIGADCDLGGFGALFDLKRTGYKDPILVSSTDGVGTKLKIAQELGIHDTIGIDLVAMCVNDLVVQGAEPLFFLDYFATGKLEVSVATDVIKGIAEGCKQAGCALIGGETAEMPSMYKDGEYDLAGFTVGAVERENILPSKNVNVGDAVIAVASSGIHSNGYSLVRKILADNNIKFSDKVDGYGFTKSIGEELLTPTKIYVKQLLSMINQPSTINHQPIKALAHITGGGITENFPRVLPKGITAQINLNAWKFPPLFKFLQDKGKVSTEEMLRTFNCGCGMLLAIDRSEANRVISELEKKGEQAFMIGEIISGDEIKYV